jgi:SAM-dependent methyltransferase
MQIMNSSLSIFSKALLDYYEGNKSATIIAIREDGWKAELPMSVFYRKPEFYALIEQKALSLCYGRTLDVGAGAGIHSLELQKAGIDVWALDISSQACEIMLKRGVRNVRCMDVFDPDDQAFDTILILGHGIGIAGTLTGLDRFLRIIHKRLNLGGQILFNSVDVRCTDEVAHLNYHESKRKEGKYFGEIKMQFEYKGIKGDLYDWLHVDPETMADHAAGEGCNCEIILSEKEGEYLARLTAK